MILSVYAAQLVADDSKIIRTQAGLTPYSASYIVDWMDSKAGTREVVLEKKADSGYLFRVNVTATGLLSMFSDLSVNEESGFSLSKSDIKLNFYNIKKIGAKKGEYIARTDKKNRTVEIKTKKGLKIVSIEDGSLTSSLFELQLMLDARRSRIQGEYRLLTKKGLTQYQLDSILDENVNVPAGNFKTKLCKFKQRGKRGKVGKRGINYYLAPELGFLPVRVEYIKKGKLKYALVLEKLPVLKK